MTKISQEGVPRHVAIIMDGNGRWAKAKGLSRTQGHIEGVKRVEETVNTAIRLGVKAVTFFTFSTENWNRPKTEVSILMQMVATALKSKTKKLKDLNVCFHSIGKEEGTPVSVLSAINTVREATKDNTGLIMNLAFNYGARMEIVDAVRDISKSVQQGDLKVDDICEKTIDQALYTKGLPDPDLLIRTSGEQRISNFLLWQLSYAEFYFTETHWPDFNAKEFEKAVSAYQNRERRYGKV